jgi:hypothetical protein
MISYTVPIILLVLSVGLFIGGVMWGKKYGDLGAHNNVDCMKYGAKTCKGDKTCCVIWKDGSCRKGKIQGDACVAKGHAGPAFLVFGGLGLFVAFIVVLIVSIVQHHRKK